MKCKKGSIEYAINLETLREMEEDIPMTLDERTHLRRWVHSGNDPENNPWGYLDEDDWPLNYLLAYRRHCGYWINVYYHYDT